MVVDEAIVVDAVDSRVVSVVLSVGTKVIGSVT